jgi:hypothetical protein
MESGTWIVSIYLFSSDKKNKYWNPPVKYVYTALTFPLFPFYVRGFIQHWKQVIICWNSPYLPPPSLWLFIPVFVCVCVCAWRAWNLRQDSPGLELVETALLISTARAKNASVVSLRCIVYPAGRRRKTSIEKQITRNGWSRCSDLSQLTQDASVLSLRVLRPGPQMAILVGSVSKWKPSLISFCCAYNVSRSFLLVSFYRREEQINESK